jgi:hypothetical protein
MATRGYDPNHQNKTAQAKLKKKNTPCASHKGPLPKPINNPPTKTSQDFSTINAAIHIPTKASENQSKAQGEERDPRI